MRDHLQRKWTLSRTSFFPDPLCTIARMRARLCACVCVCLVGVCAYVCAHTCFPVQVYACVHVSELVRVCLHVCLHARARARACVCVCECVCHVRDCTLSLSLRLNWRPQRWHMNSRCDECFSMCSFSLSGLKHTSLTCTKCAVLDLVANPGNSYGRFGLTWFSIRIHSLR